MLTLIGIAMIIDFATGTFASKINKEIKFESNKGINGVVDVSHVYKDYLSGSNNKKIHIPKTSSFDESITNYQVAVGMFSDKDKATEMLDKLKEKGINGFKIIETDKEISLDSPRFGYIGNYEVDVDSVFVRAKPEDNAEKIGIIYKGSKYSMSDKIGAWLEFKYREGYVSADFMEEIE